MTNLLKKLLTNPMGLVGFLLVLGVLFCALFAPWLSPREPLEIDYDIYLAPPGRDSLMGGDDLGRDVLSRVLYGARLSLIVGLVSQLIALTIGLVVGLLAGYYGGWLDTILMRFTELILAFPFVILAVGLVVALGPSVTNSFLALGLAGWPYIARVVRAQVMVAKQSDYVQAARALGVNDLGIMWQHLLPNTLSPVIVLATAGIASAILAEAGLSFLGLGPPAPAPSWGSMLFLGRSYLREAPWISGFPGFAIFITVLGFNLLGDGLRDALDVRLR